MADKENADGDRDSPPASNVVWLPDLTDSKARRVAPRVQVDRERVLQALVRQAGTQSSLNDFAQWVIEQAMSALAIARGDRAAAMALRNLAAIYDKPRRTRRG
jgi:hypothetical protein